ncbi:MAG: hypothetical protein HC828_17990 [Blastochloris sp.]|nr:hypothetical protein [Blastochloris sp.]
MKQAAAAIARLIAANDTVGKGDVAQVAGDTTSGGGGRVLVDSDIGKVCRAVEIANSTAIGRGRISSNDNSREGSSAVHTVKDTAAIVDSYIIHNGRITERGSAAVYISGTAPPQNLIHCP